MVQTPDGGQVAIDWTLPRIPDEQKVPTLVVLHGLTGGSHESYVRSLLEVVKEKINGIYTIETKNIYIYIACSSTF